MKIDKTKIGEKYIVLTSDNEVLVAERIKKTMLKNKEGVPTPAYFCDSTGWMFSSVTHWRYLPTKNDALTMEFTP